ncbi:E3 ubiquitin/ISG15 ligase TRIM25-like [Phyllobates terribilis]|uniref:E3 ubiquitin/ISG15 ligase TRIM25-like n=1 Tax=Phyllobates terribilis TaxID=111132 RepID=UPI003CCB6E1B
MACAEFEDELLCSICLRTFEDPVPLRCGHNFCRMCIEFELDAVFRKGSGDFTCPDCKAELEEHPIHPRNLTPSNTAEGFLSTRLEQVDAGLFCIYCIHVKIPAVKSCLHCEASLCDSHLKVHSKSEEHILTDPIVFKESKRCPIHDKVLQYYCPKDATCICLLCRLAGDHIGHPVEQLNEATKKKKKKMRNVLKKMIKKNEKIEEKLQSLKEQQNESHKETTREMKKVTALFRSIRSMLDDLETKVLTHHSTQDNHVSLISDLIREMEIKKDEICSKISHLEELCFMTNPWSILQEPLPSQENLFVSQEDATLVESKALHPADGLDAVVISEILYKGFTDVMTFAKKNIFSHEETDLLLDTRRAGVNVDISDDLKMASWSQIKQIRPGQQMHLERCQVLSTCLFSSGRHFWDVETSKSGTWNLGVCYVSMPKSGDMAEIGSNNKSWCLSKFHNSSQYSVAHNDREVLIEQKTPNNKFRLYLDYEAGKLSFYELDDPIRLLHVVTTKFKEPLHAAFYVCNGWVRIA